MKKNKIIIYVLGILLILLIIATVFLVNIRNSQKGNIENTETENNITGESQENIFEDINDTNMYYTVKSIIDNYIVYVKHITGDEYVDITEMNTTLDEVNNTYKTNAITAIKNILDTNYLNEMGVNDNTILERYMKLSQNGNYQQDIYYAVNIDRILTAKRDNGIILNLVESKINNQSFNLIIKLDTNNVSYSFFLDDYIEKYNFNENISEENINIDNSSITINPYNTYVNVEATDEYVAMQLFSDYKMKMMHDSQEAYNILDEEYKNKKYANYEDFSNYINSNNEIIETATLEGYLTNNLNGQKEYICIDQYGKYYIFNQKSIINYTVILDTYTVDLPNFLEEYNRSNDAEKVGLNLQKAIDALKDGDYKYVYNKLDGTFKTNNFPTEEDFENYMKNAIYSLNIVTFSNYQQSSNLHMYDITFADNNNSHSITKTFIMQLKEGTDFVMSFNV